MRIITGQWRGRKLKSPTGMTTRPTAQRTKETLFAMLISRIGDFEELRVLDLFAGSGALGLEALSRGAAHCTFVDEDRRAIDCIKANSAHVGAEAVSQYWHKNVLQLGEARQGYDIIFMDPPYGTGAANVALDKLGRQGWFAPSSWIAIETDKGENIDVKGFTVETSRKSGRALIHLVRPE